MKLGGGSAIQSALSESVAGANGKQGASRALPCAAGHRTTDLFPLAKVWKLRILK